MPHLLACDVLVQSPLREDGGATRSGETWQILLWAREQGGHQQREVTVVVHALPTMARE